MKTSTILIFYALAVGMFFEQVAAEPELQTGCAQCDPQELTDAECEDMGPDCEDLDERREVHAAGVCLRMNPAIICAKKYLDVEIICETKGGGNCKAERRYD